MVIKKPLEKKKKTNPNKSSYKTNKDSPQCSRESLLVLLNLL